jgi:hypothetical protein
VPKSILDAIKEGHWDYEPPEVDYRMFEACDAMPGTVEKIQILAERLRQGLPLWHVEDRSELDVAPQSQKPR